MKAKKHLKKRPSKRLKVEVDPLGQVMRAFADVKVTPRIFKAWRSLMQEIYNDAVIRGDFPCFLQAAKILETAGQWR